MNKRNFNLIIELSSKYLNSPKYVKNKDSLLNLYKLGLVMQELESELWDGYPYIYANMRVLIEEIMNFFIEKELKIVIEEGNGEEYMSSDGIDQWIKGIKEGAITSWRRQTIRVEKSTFNLFKKIELLLACFSQKGIDLLGWELHVWRKQLNDTNHNFFLPAKETEKGFEKRFKLLGKFHNLIYRKLVKMYFRMDVGDYQEPTEDELVIIASKYNQRIESYI